MSDETAKATATTPNINHLIIRRPLSGLKPVRMYRDPGEKSISFRRPILA